MKNYNKRHFAREKKSKSLGKILLILLISRTRNQYTDNRSNKLINQYTDNSLFIIDFEHLFRALQRCYE